ncbi:MAG: hypothetical protein IPI67_25210 [Myxococcales bacterium]|nr:hypothetical protein [Myxococcales bacterium]
MRNLNAARRAGLAIGLSGLLSVSLGGCGGNDDGGTVGPSLGGAGGGGANAGGGGSAASGANGGSGGGINLDGGGASTGTGGGGGTKGCEKIDFLFIVDNSVSMEPEQAALVAAFPGFIAAVESTVAAGSNYHVMVADTDEWGRCNTANPWTGIDPTSTTCNGYIKKTKFEECDRTLGAGVINPAGEFASNKICPFPAGRRFLQQGDPNVPAAFACAAQVGVAGHSKERPMDAMLAALTPQINAAGGCNEGFLRDDALLVVTFISDDPNYEDKGTPQSWYDAVVAAKKGDPKAAVVVGFTPATCGGGGTTKGAHWEEFIKKFPFSIAAPVCATDYATTFAQAVNVVDDSCDQYVPPIK